MHNIKIISEDLYISYLEQSNDRYVQDIEGRKYTFYGMYCDEELIGVLKLYKLKTSSACIFYKIMEVRINEQIEVSEYLAQLIDQIRLQEELVNVPNAAISIIANKYGDELKKTLGAIGFFEWPVTSDGYMIKMIKDNDKFVHYKY